MQEKLKQRDQDFRLAVRRVAQLEHMIASPPLFRNHQRRKQNGMSFFTKQEMLNDINNFDLNGNGNFPDIPYVNTPQHQGNNENTPQHQGSNEVNDNKPQCKVSIPGIMINGVVEQEATDVKLSVPIIEHQESEDDPFMLSFEGSFVSTGASVTSETSKGSDENSEDENSDSDSEDR